MNPNVPSGAATLLDFIGSTEAPKGYGTIYGNNQGKLRQPLTSMTLDQVIAAGPTWTKSYRSSAAGRYQFMNATLKDLKKSLGLKGSLTFNADLQDRLGYELLKRRGYEDFMSGRITRQEFGKRLAQEWASFPVLGNTQGQTRAVERGQSYYAGDGLNKALVKPEAVEAVLSQIRPAAPQSRPQQPVPPTKKPAKSNAAAIAVIAVLVLLALAFIITHH
jgi:muramidase (phage lysozyme)